MKNSTVEGGCLCGDVRYRITGEPMGTSICHCDNCRRAGGGVCVGWLVFHCDDFELVKGKPNRYRYRTEEGRPADRGFCGNCGTQLSYEGGADDIGITTVTLDDPNTYPPKYQVEVSEKLPWVELWDLD